jgi:hypothetical protein
MKKLAFVAAVAIACGGSQKPEVAAEPAPGELHAQTPPAEPAPPVTPPASEPAPPAPGPVAPPAGGPFIELRNEADLPLNFGVTKGWGPVVFAYTGKPPKAKAVILFESACTASCDSPPDAVCPDCPEPKDKKEEQAMARTQTVEPGTSFQVPWDGKVRVYEKVAGKRCKCFTTMEPPADSYTIKACGLRPPKQPGKPSRPVCAETVVTLGPGQPPPIVLSFPK